MVCPLSSLRPDRSLCGFWRHDTLIGLSHVMPNTFMINKEAVFLFAVKVPKAAPRPHLHHMKHGLRAFN